MFWFGILVGGMIGGVFATFLYCLLTIGKEADSYEHSDEHIIK